MEEKTDVLAQAESTDEADVQKEVAGKTAKAGLLHVEMRSFVWLCLLILAACLLGLSKYLFEGRLFVFANDIGSDTWQQYLSLYAAIARKIAAGDFSLWSTTIGFGTSIFMLNPGNPALVVAYLLGAACGVEILPSVMIFLYIAEIFAAGILAYLYLSTFSFGEVPKLLAAFMYAFSGFMIVWGQHYQFAIVPALTMLELLMAERCLKGRRFVGLVLATAISVISSMYIAYMLLLFTGVYLLLRLFLRERKLRIYIKEAFRVLWPILLGVGLAMVTLLPSAANIFLVSSRMERYASLAERLFDPLPGAYYLALLERLFSCAAQGVDPEGPYLNYYEGPCIFFTTLFIPLIWQYICLLRGRKITKRRMRLAIVLLLVGLLAMLTPTAGTIFNGFTGTFNRYMFLFMPGFALLSAVTLQEIFHEHRFSLLGAFLASLMLVLGYGWIILEDLDTRMDFVMIAHVVGGTAMLIFLHLASGGESVFDDVGSRRLQRIWANAFRHTALILSLILLVNVVAELSANFRSRGSLAVKDSRLEILEDEETRAALAKLKAEDPGWYRVEKAYGATDTMDAPFQGYRGISNYSSTMNANVIDFVDMEWPVLAFEAPNHLTFRSWKLQAYEDEARLLGLRYLLVIEGRIDAFNDDWLEPRSNRVLEIPDGFEKIDSVGSVDIYMDNEAPGMLSYYPANAVKDGSVSYRDRDASAKIISTANGPEDRLEATVTAREDGLLFVAIPYEVGWKAFVDGVETELVQANKGFNGIWLTAGTHEVSLVYECPGVRMGAYISLASLAVLALLVGLDIRRRRKATVQVIP